MPELRQCQNSNLAVPDLDRLTPADGLSQQRPPQAVERSHGLWVNANQWQAPPDLGEITTEMERETSLGGGGGGARMEKVGR